MKNNKKLGLLSIYCLFSLLMFSTGLSAAQQPVNKDYIIGSGDELQIQVWDHDDLNRTVEVSHDGTFSFPFIGKVRAAGKSVFELQNYLIKKLSDGYLVAPQVTVGIAQYRNKKAFILGEVHRPGSYILKQNMHLLELISEAGGFTANRGTVCTIIRSAEAKNLSNPVPIKNASAHEIIKIDLTRLANGDPSENIAIEPNDSIYISAVSHIFVTGEVRNPGEVNFAEGMTVHQAISMAGGGTPKAALGRTRIVRMQNGKEVEIKPALSDTVFPNDIIKVPESYF
jgi:polysaccharide biosynthesis/export protein